ncbi:restriction endonuclease subunit S [Terasakiella pusilla]|uniref:restriction endonuclease subunit S n=1 Tax=Terasakiella pusilla TaxID=64973 RepID=UPI00068B70C9|nr:restriction endonuclease subunit S [Terasakiella pusilla]
MNITKNKKDWPVVKFGDVVKNANLTERDPVGAGIERVVGLEHIDPENLHIRRWNTDATETSFTRKFVPGQTLFGKRRAYQRKVAYAEFEGICSSDILTFETKDPETLLSELIPFICQSDAFFDHALGTSAGSLSPRTSWKALHNYQFRLPPIDEQKRISELLWSIDQTHQSFLKAVLELEIYKDAYLEARITEHADVRHVPATELTDRINVGIVIKPASYYVKNGGTPALRSLNIWPNRFDLSEMVYISDEGQSKNKKSILKENVA